MCEMSKVNISKMSIFIRTWQNLPTGSHGQVICMSAYGQFIKSACVFYSSGAERFGTK